MTFHLTVSGVVPTKEIEEGLVGLLHDIFTNPSITVQSSAYSGTWVSGELHHAHPVHAPAPPETEPAGSGVDAGAAHASPEPDPDPEPPAAAESADEAPADETNVAA